MAVPHPCVIYDFIFAFQYANQQPFEKKTNLTGRLLACLLACLFACLPACLLACLPACLLACLLACWYKRSLGHTRSEEELVRVATVKNLTSGLIEDRQKAIFSLLKNKIKTIFCRGSFSGRV
jgi:hypothetical protein